MLLCIIPNNNTASLVKSYRNEKGILKHRTVVLMKYLDYKHSFLKEKSNIFNRSYNKLTVVKNNDLIT